MPDEGYIKFDCRWIEGPPPPAAETEHLTDWRNRLHRLGMIGVYPDGIGYGNVSARRGDSAEFIISGTQTGAIATIDERHCAIVIDYDIEANALRCSGPVRASSESLTHAAIYRAEPAVQGVIHVHHPAAWEGLLGILPTTRADVPYGTPAMAHEIERLLRESALASGRVAVMGGHREGIIALGADLDDAGESLLSALRGYY